jgi:sodium/proline symporter
VSVSKLNSSSICIVIAIVAYLAMMLYLGFRYSRASRSAGEFYLGGRQLGPYVTAMSAEASDMSSWLLMGLPGVAYASGICDAFWTAVGLAIGTYLNWRLVAQRLRHYTAVAGDSVTVPDFFENRFRDKSHVLMGLSALIIVVFFIPYTASGFAACGKLFSSLFGVDYMVAMVVSALVIILYTTMGGFLAASTTDFIQSIVMTSALIVVLIFGISQAGGVGSVLDYTGSLPGYLSLLETFDASTNQAVSYGPITILSTLAWGLGYFGMPHILLRFMGIQDPNKLKVSRRVASTWVTISMGLAIVIGMLGLSMVHSGAIAPLDDSERVIIAIATKLASYGILPALLAGVVMAGILACTMSTCDSQMLAASSSVSENILQGVFGLKISEKMRMVFARLTLVLIAVIGIVMARDPNSSVFGIVSFAWAGFGGAFGAVVLCALFWRRANRWGALAGMLGGGGMVFLWKFAVRPLGGIWNIYELLPAFLTSLALVIVVSLLTPAPSQEICEEFDKVKSMQD